MTNTIEPGLGSLKIAPDVIVAYVTEAVLNTPGVFDFSGNFGDTLSKNLLGIESKFKGIKIDDNEKGCFIDLYVIVDYGIKIPEVAWNIQKNVKNCLEDVMDLNVEDINIHIQGVNKPDGTEAEAEAEGEQNA